jgi:hypothetical protein
MEDAMDLAILLIADAALDVREWIEVPAILPQIVIKTGIMTTLVSLVDKIITEPESENRPTRGWQGRSERTTMRYNNSST